MDMKGYVMKRKKSRIMHSICPEQPGKKTVVSFTVGRLGALVWIILKAEPSQSLFGRWSQKTGVKDSDLEREKSTKPMSLGH